MNDTAQVQSQTAPVPSPFITADGTLAGYVTPERRYSADVCGYVGDVYAYSTLAFDAWGWRSIGGYPTREEAVAAIKANVDDYYEGRVDLDTFRARQRQYHGAIEAAGMQDAFARRWRSEHAAA
jgi:hypothetical protein